MFINSKRSLRLVLVIILLTVTVAIRLIAQNAPPAEIRKAQQLYQAKEYDAVISALEDFTTRNPATQFGWTLLGNSYRQKGELDKALEAHLKATTFRPTRFIGTFNAANIHALKGNKDEAFKLLQFLRDSGNFDMDQLKSSADLGGLKDDPRFAKLLPKPEDFANPFVEKVKIIHEWVGETKGDQFGWIARSIGDVDGDKVKDIATSAPTYQVNGQPAGRVYVYSGKSGKLLWMQTGKPGDQLGIGIECAGDANHDGIPDVIAAAPGAGKAYVYSGKDGKVLLTLGAGDSSEGFGRHASTAGDVNSDGYDDVLVGAPGNNTAGQAAGRAYVYSGKDGTLLLTLDGERAGDSFGSAVVGYKDKRHAFLIVGAPNHGGGRVYVYTGLASKTKFVFDADETGAQFGGMFLSVVGDINGDKTPDIYASDFSNNAKGPSTGRIYVYSGADGKKLLTMTGETAGDGFGIGSAEAGDVNRDGFDDLIIGAWQHAGAATSAGKVYLYSGKDGSLMRTITCRIPGDTFGFDATGIGDVDGDGVIDFLLTSAWSGIKGYQSGRVFIISGKLAK
ncbi:MAG: FG-GAP-like repeat-containing protein [Blastocatellia bacterium]